jgi:hypothetical protein
MKTKISILSILFILITACEGDPGPQGPPGVNILGQVFEVTVDFSPANNYQVLVEFPQDIEVFESDVVMVYLLETEISDSSGPIDVWTPLPQSFFFDNGSELVYNFNHTFLDVSLFLDGNTNLDTIPFEFIDDKEFRIAILPAGFANNPNVDLYDYMSIQKQLENNLNFKIKKID